MHFSDHLAFNLSTLTFQQRSGKPADPWEQINQRGKEAGYLRHRSFSLAIRTDLYNFGGDCFGRADRL
jgi:hypothetical protein